jgi:PiT family inorganic phosphate transporter
VIIASTLGLPVSSTHIAVGAVFGVGFLREFITNRRVKFAMPKAVGAQAGFENGTPPPAAPSERSWAKARARKLVRRKHLITIIAAWLITVPASAVLAAILFFVINKFN